MMATKVCKVCLCHAQHTIKPKVSVGNRFFSGYGGAGKGLNTDKEGTYSMEGQLEVVMLLATN